MEPGIDRVRAAYDLGYERTETRAWPVRITLRRSGHTWEFRGRRVSEEGEQYRIIVCRSCGNGHTLEDERSGDRAAVLQMTSTLLEDYDDAVRHTAVAAEGYGRRAVYAVLDGNIDAALGDALRTVETERRLLGDCRVWAPLREAIEELAGRHLVKSKP